VNPQAESHSSDGDESGALEEEIQRKVSELAAALDRASRRGDERGAEITDRAIEDLSPSEQGALRKAFGGAMREQLLEVFLETSPDVAPASTMPNVDERVSNVELVALVQRLYRQFMSIESAVVAISTEFMQEGQKIKLPGHFANLKGYVLQLLHDGGEDAVEKINDYLGDINRWIAASLKAWELAPDRWWSEWWERISPKAVEQRSKVGFMGNKYGEYWKNYREMSRDLTPPEAKSQIFEIAGRIAREAMA